jgi:hypothetical protein
MNMGFLKSFGGMQKKVTRGVHPLSLPSNVLEAESCRWPTRKEKRSETGQQASTDSATGAKSTGATVCTARMIQLQCTHRICRTHRERKENYIKALEIELARLRETYIVEQNKRDATIQQQKVIIENQQRENLALREVLASRGIAFDNELENRKAMMAMKPKREENSMTPPSMSTLSPPSVGNRSAAYGTVRGPGSVASGYSPQAYLSTTPMAVSGHSPGATQYGGSPQGPDIQELSIKQEEGAIPDLPGIFEREPQLGIDFILK